jgi:hypothetical protein
MYRNLRSIVLTAVVACAAAVSAAVARAAPDSEAIRWNERGLTLTEERRHAEAVEAFRRAHDAAPEDDTIRRNLALARSNLAVRLLKEGDVERASEHAEEALELQPDDPIVVLNVAACLDERGYPARAAEHVRRARKIGHGVAHVHERMGAVHYREGNLKSAIEEWRLAIALDPENEKLRTRLTRAKRSAAVEATLSQQLSAHFEVLHDAEGAVLASLVLRELEDAYRVVNADLQNAPAAPVKVVLLSTEQFRETTGTNTWVAGLFDGRIRLPVKGVSEDRSALLARARHEYVHAALAPLGKRSPSWLHEGLAQIHEGRPVAPAQQRVARTRAVPFDDLTRSFAATQAEAKARLQYDTALSFVAWLREGERGSSFRLAMQRLFEDVALDAAFQDAYGALLPDLYTRFQASLR